MEKKKYISNLYRIQKACVRNNEIGQKSRGQDLKWQELGRFKYVHFFEHWAVATDKLIVAILDLSIASTLDAEDLEKLNGKTLDAKSFEKVCSGEDLLIGSEGITVKSQNKAQEFYRYADIQTSSHIPILIRIVEAEEKKKTGSIDEMMLDPNEMKKICEVLNGMPLVMKFHKKGGLAVIEDKDMGLKIAFYHK